MRTTDADNLRAAIGPRSEYYLKRFEKIERAGDRWVAGWNWPAFFVSTAWFRYRGLTGWAWANFLLPLPFILLLSQGEANVIMFVYVVIAFVVIPLNANALYYRNLTKRIARAAAHVGGETAARMPRPPTGWAAVEAALMAAFAFAFSLFFAIAPVAYSDYPSRAKVAEGLIMAASIKDQIGEFYAKHRRLPASHESGQFRDNGPTQYTESAAYDADKKMIVITYRDPFAGKRVALHAEGRNGTLNWTCRTIDLDPKYLPATCR
jgi:hypothetical protein